MLDWFYEKWAHASLVVKNIFRFLVRLWAFLPLIWRDRDWDHQFLFEILRFKLDRMQYEHATDPWCVNSHIKAKQLRTCVLLLDRLIADDYAKQQHAEHIARWGELEMIDSQEQRPGCHTWELEHAKVKTEADKKKQRAEFKRIMNHEDLQRKQDMRLLMTIISKHVWGWWI